jgi:hypothetical protein
MAVTLEDVALLFGLPCSGEPIGAAEPPPPTRAVARRPPREVCWSGAPSQHARGTLLLSFFHSIGLQPLTEF